ncbi:hypothetical protein NM208_g15219 [Fusarium decemcellulare]|uniref:Uncharacterized protein n=1 Tax=Fusarium decemcellulare TaxID=57161 RepID=A0ACC1RDN1_9HYPO|nr:hypothetical protein NM208_g15219 [Fusarium decemcellulare]
MTDLKDFDVIRVARSDGADTGPGYWPLTAPLAATKKTKDSVATEKTPRTKPQMIRLAEDDPRFVEWKVKLGILLKQELCPTPDGEAVQEPPGICCPSDMAALNLHGLPRLLLRALQRV